MYLFFVYQLSYKYQLCLRFRMIFSIRRKPEIQLKYSNSISKHLFSYGNIKNFNLIV